MSLRAGGVLFVSMDKEELSVNPVLPSPFPVPRPLFHVFSVGSSISQHLLGLVLYNCKPHKVIRKILPGPEDDRFCPYLANTWSG